MKIAEYIFFRLVKGLLAITPFTILYLIPDFFAFLLEHVFQYRKKVIISNLKKAFPVKSNRRIQQITHQFYKYLCDLFFESVKGYSISTKQLLKRYECLNPEIMHSYFENGQDVIIALSHYANWEWGTQLASTAYEHNVATFYKPMSNKYIDVYLQKLRMRNNMELLSIYKPYRINHIEGEKPKMYFMVSDQSPDNQKNAQWVKFLNQDTACIRGIEYYAKLFKLPVFYLDVQRVKRGYYTVEMLEICTNPAICKKGEIVDLYMKQLESIITKNPEYWLWSHRRWKLTRS
jgi:KDO2-lipid IV(A) lauroyltransferase